MRRAQKELYPVFDAFLKSCYEIHKNFPYDVTMGFQANGSPVVRIETEKAAEHGEFHTNGIPHIEVWINNDLVVNDYF